MPRFYFSILYHIYTLLTSEAQLHGFYAKKYHREFFPVV